MEKPLRVLIIEDSDDDSELLLRELRRIGYEVEFERVETGGAMRAMLSEREWDLILSDYTLPKFNATQALETLKISGLDLPFIIISGTIGEETAVAALKAGANDFIVKGTYARLGPAIERELREAKSRRDHRRTEEQIKYHARLLRHINDAVIATDAQFRITAWNRAAERIYGWSAADVMGRSADEVLTSSLSEEQQAKAKELLKENSAFRSERIHAKKSGQLVYVEENTMALTDQRGKITGYVSVNRDVTERRRAEETILQLAAIVESSDDAIIGQSLEGMIVSWNLAAERLYGYSADEVFGKPISNIFPSGQLNEGMRILERLNAAERIEHFETVRLRKDGQRIHISASVSPIKDASGKMIGISSIERDISESKKAEEILRQHSLQQKERRRLAVVAEFVAILALGLLAFLLELKLNLFSQLLINYRVTYAQVDEILVMVIFLGLGTAVFSLRRWSEAESEITHRQGVQEALRTLHAELETRVQERTADLAKSNLALKNEITERKQAQEALQKSEEQYRFLFENNPLPMWVYDIKTLAFLAVNGWAVEKYGYTREEFLHMTITEIRPIEDVSRLMADVSKLRPALQQSGEWRHRLKDGTIIDVEITSHILRIDERDAALIVAKDITEQKRAQEALQEKERLLSEAQRIGHIGSWSYVISTDTLQFSDEMYRLFDISKEKFQHTQDEFLSLIYSADRPTVKHWMELIRAGRQAKELDFRIFHKSGELRYLHIRGAVVFDPNGNPARFIGTAQDISDRKLAEIQIRQQLDHLTALRRIDQAITSSFHLLSTLEIVFSQVLSELQVDAVDILLLNPDGQMLEYVGGQGFRTMAAENARVPIGASHAGRAAQERHLIQIPNLKEKPGHPLRAALLAEEGFVCCFVVPLIAKGKVQGVMELFYRRPFQPYPDWLDFLETLAGQAAIAIENATLFENLERSNQELSHAYDATIEGWARALDLRDKETEGHTRRVTEMTITLARAFGFPEDEIVHIRWGALLHDIGKLGVPDHILLKPGELTPEEWQMMRRHPEFAYNMLVPITYLHRALDIPYYHHEKWDGTGYPHGLKGEAIPLAARLFAVVDVWDALRSDRPYRLAWAKEKTLEHIQSLSGTHFDPKVIEYFLDVIQ